MDEAASHQNNVRRPTIRDVQIERPMRSSVRSERADAPRQAPRRRGAIGWWILAAVLLIAASVVSLPIVFSDTTLQITPVVTKASYENASFTAVPQGNDTGASVLTYNTLEWTSGAKRQLEPTDRTFVEQKASGVITVYNEYTTGNQRLIKNTRFETSDGRVYRVRESIVVPGKKTVGGETVPGTLDVTVYADDAGEEYNLTSGSFTLPGLKSIPDMYSTIYAKVKTPVVGGFSGERAVVGEATRANTLAELKSEVEDTIRSEVVDRLPVDARTFDNTLTISFAEPEEREVDGKVELTQSATAQVLVFDEIDFTRAISAGVAGNPNGGYPSIQQPETFTVQLAAADGGNEEGGDETEAVKLLVDGNIDFVWRFDEDMLKNDLAGKNREALRTILAGYPSIKSAEAIIRPFWRSTFPSNPSDFTLKYVGVE